VSGVRVRPATTWDVDAITQLMNAHGTAVHGESEAAPTTVLEWLEDPELVIRLGERDGRLACYGDIVFSADGTRANLDIREHPGAPASAGPMFEELEAIANERGATRVWAFHTSEERELAALARARGYTPIRQSFRMLVHLDAAPEPARWPEGITVREMRESEQRATHAAGNEAFADHWEFEPAPYERFARWNFEGANFDRSLSFLALDDDEIAGICLCSVHLSGDPTYGWVGILGVRPPWRRRGIALALLLHSFAVFRERGCTRVGLGVDAESTTGALELYERAGMHVHRCQDTLEKLL
jgi:mycothiol synthase